MEGRFISKWGHPRRTEKKEKEKEKEKKKKSKLA